MQYPAFYVPSQLILLRNVRSCQTYRALNGINQKLDANSASPSLATYLLNPPSHAVVYPLFVARGLRVLGVFKWYIAGKHKEDDDEKKSDFLFGLWPELQPL